VKVLLLALILSGLPATAQQAEVPSPQTAAAPVMTPELAVWIMRTSDAETLIRWYWRDTPHVALMLRIARREAGMNCAADNPRSSAAGLFQTMGFHRALAESMAVPEGEPKLTWANVAGSDCWDDVRLAWQLYDHGRGLSNWSPLP
jgi:hypothetical protein